MQANGRRSAPRSGRAWLALLAGLALAPAACTGTSTPGGTRPRDSGAEPDGRMGIVPADGSTPDAGPRDAGPPPLPDPPGDRTLDYVVRILHVGRESPAGSGIAPGYDVDGHVTERVDDPIGCGHLDFTSPARYGAVPGVDNQLGDVLSGIADLGVELDAESEIAKGVREGDVLLLLRLLHVGDGAGLRNDGHVTVRAYLGKLPAGTMPALEAVDDDGTIVMTLASGQRFPVDPSSVEGGDLERPLILFENAEIREGRLRAGPSVFSLRTPIRDAGVLELDIQQARLEADVAEDALSLGLVGGYLEVDSIVANLVSLDLPDVTIPPSLAESFLGESADIDLDARHGCEAITVALTFAATDATLGAVAAP